LQKIAQHINPGVFYALQPRNKHYELSNHLGNVLAVISDMKLYTCHEYNKFEDFENNPNINGDWNIRNSWEGQNAVLDLAYGKLHVVDSITSNPHVRINYLLPKHLPANQTYRIKFDLEHIIGDQNWQIGIASSNTDSTYESNFSFFSGGTGHNEITFRPTGPIWRIRFLHLPVAQNMEFYFDNFSIENLSLDSNTIAMADIVSATDYYAFGSTMPGRSFQSGGYRFGFNGKESDGETQTQDYGMRIYDYRLGRFLSVDPLTSKYPFYSPYQFAGNSPIKFIDLDGAEPDLCPLNMGKNSAAKKSLINLSDFKSILDNIFSLKVDYSLVILSEKNYLIDVEEGGKITNKKLEVNGGNSTDKVEVSYDMYKAKDKLELFENGGSNPVFSTDGFVKDQGYDELLIGTKNIRVVVTPAPGETNSGYLVNIKFKDERVMKTKSFKVFGLTLFKTREVLSASESRTKINQKNNDDNPNNNINPEIDKPVATKVETIEVK